MYKNLQTNLTKLFISDIDGVVRKGPRLFILYDVVVEFAGVGTCPFELHPLLGTRGIGKRENEIIDCGQFVAGLLDQILYRLSDWILQPLGNLVKIFF